MKIAIRDDDVCFFTKQTDFEKAYCDIEVPISVSIIPNAYPYHGNSAPYGDDLPKKCMSIADNPELVRFLKNKIVNREIEVLLHGFDHIYSLKNKKMIPEMIWKKKEVLKKEIPEGKKLLESLFDITISVFVAPSNEINQKGISIIEDNNMNFSGCFHGFSRRFDFYFLRNCFKRYFSRIKYGVPLGGTMVFKNHKELNTIGITTLEKLKKIYLACKKNKWNMVLVSHYWQLRDNPELKNTLSNFICFLKMQEDVEFTFVSDCF